MIVIEQKKQIEINKTFNKELGATEPEAYNVSQLGRHYRLFLFFCRSEIFYVTGGKNNG